MPLFEFAIRTQIKKFDLNTAEGRVNALSVAAPLIAQIKDRSLRPEYIRLVSGWIGLDAEIVSKAVAQGGKKVEISQPSVESPSWRPDPNEPRLILEREVLKARLQIPAFVVGWSEIEEHAFSHPAYREFRAVIDMHDQSGIPLTMESITNENMRSLFTELSVEPIRADGEISERYVASIVPRLREVAVSRTIADVKSTLQRLNPVENEAEYNAAFANLVALESTRRALHEASLGSI